MEHEAARARLVEELRKEVDDPRVLEVFALTPREKFVPAEHASLAYENVPLPIGEGQTISQPLVVAIMHQGLSLKPADLVLDVGTGSGYQAALLSNLAGAVVSVERVPALEERARELLDELGHANVTVLPAGPVLGCPDRAPYNAIIIAAAAPAVAPELADQLALGGRMVIPMGTQAEQNLVRVVRWPDKPEPTSLGPCRFVPLIGPGAWPRETHSPNGNTPHSP